MRKCSVCKKKDEGIKESGSFFKFPKNKTKRMKWNEVFGKEFTRSACLCQDHFLITDYRKVGSKTLLMPNAVPVPYVECIREPFVPPIDTGPPIDSSSIMDNDNSNECFINGVLYKCRTCFDPGLTMYPLEDKCSESKTWGDFLKDIAQLQTNEDELLPKSVCCKCFDKIKAFYDFKLQIENVNRKYLELLANSSNLPEEVGHLNKIDISVDCLAESEMEMVDIVTPSNLNRDNHVVSMDIYNVKIRNSMKLKEDKSSLGDLSNKTLNNDNHHDLLIGNIYNGTSTNSMQLEKHKRLLDDQSDQNLNDNINNISYLSSEEDDSVSPTSLNDKIGKIDNHFVCLVCKQTFSFRGCCRRHIQLKHSKRTKLNCGFCEIILSSRDNLYRHLKQKHPGEDLESNMKQIQRIFGERIYSEPTTWSLVECKLCLNRFRRTKDLREHLEKHGDINTLHKMQTNDLIVQHMFPNIKNLDIIKKIISKDISEKNYFKYYTVLNEFNYEMSISDTEVEDVEDESAEHANKYECELCDRKFSFKYQVFSHLKEYHYRSKFPWTCNGCKLEFVSKQIYEQHIETHCYNKNKILRCTRCPGTFIWPQNMKNHNCALNISNSEDIDRKIVTKIGIRKPIIRCTLCDQSFKKLRQLHQHMQTHADGKTGVDFENSIYVNIVKQSKKSSEPEKLQSKIQKAYSKSQISLFYQAIDTQGNELDISDSDSCTDDSNSGEDVETEYVCEICNEIFKQRKILLQHQEKTHKNDNLPFKCRVCNQEYVNFHLLQQHFKKVCLNKHRRIAKQCIYCKARFIWPNNLLIHKEIQHPKSIETFLNDNNPIAKHFSSTTTTEFLNESSLLFYCLMCPKIFFTNEHLNTHLLRHRVNPTDINTVDSIMHSTLWPNGDKKINCKICNQTFKTMASLKEHFSPTNLQSICSNQHSLRNYSITNQKGFELHLELDSETEDEDEEMDSETEDEYEANVCGTSLKKNYPYLCYICNKSFKRKYQVAQHQRAVHNYYLIDLKCERCIFRTVSQKILDYHKATQCFNVEKKYECEQCNFKFMWEENLCNHIKIFNTPNDLNTTESTNVMICNKSSLKNNKLTEEHNELLLLSKSENDSNENKTMARKVKVKSQQLCPICGVYLSGSSSLTLHMRKHSGEKPYKCNLCNMTYSRKGNLTDHLRIHTGERPYKCTDCEKTFAKRHVFIRHRRIHTGERPYKCKFCEKTFYHNSNHQIHERTHTGERPYTCKVCNKTFAVFQNLKNHRLKKGHT